MNDVAARAAAISKMDPTIKLSVDDKNVIRSLAALRIEFAALKTAGDKIGLQDLAARLRALGDAANVPRVKLSALRLESAALQAAIGAGGAAAGGGGGLTGALGALGPALGAVAIAGAAVLTTALFPMLATIPLIGAGVVGFGAIAVPVFQRVWAAAGQGRAAIERLPKAMEPAANAALSLRTAFDRFAKSLQPQILQAFTTGMDILRRLLPAIEPLIRAAANAFDGLLKSIDKWVASPAGRKFIQWMERDGPHAIEIFGRIVWDVINAIGRAFSFLNNEGLTMQHNFKANFQNAADTIDWFRNVFLQVSHAVAAALAWLSATFTMNVAGMIRTVAHWAAEVGHWVMVAVGWFRRLPGMIISAVGNLGSLLWNAGKSVIDGLIAGIKSAIPGLSSVLGWLKSLIPSWKGPLEDDLRLLYPHGRAIMTGLIGGIQSRVPDLEAQMRQVTAAVAGHPGYGGGYGGGTIVFELHSTGTALEAMFWTWFQHGVRVKGGDPAIISRKVVFR